MSQSQKMLAITLVLAAAACGRGERRDTATADSLSRDLQLAPTDTTAAVRPGADTAGRVATTTPPAAETPSARPSTPARTTPSRTTREPARTPSRPSSTTPSSNTSSQPATSTAARSLASGTSFSATTTAEIRSNKNKVGDQIAATIDNDVKDASGRTVIPAGSTVNLKVTAIHESENKSDTTGTLTLDVASVSMNGRDIPVHASISGVRTTLEGRKTGAGDVAKVGAGAGIGAVAGRVLGGSTKGAVIGGIIGGAVGAQRAVETKDRDVVVPAGSKVTITLDEKFTPTA